MTPAAHVAAGVSFYRLSGADGEPTIPAVRASPRLPGPGLRGAMVGRGAGGRPEGAFQPRSLAVKLMTTPDGPIVRVPGWR